MGRTRKRPALRNKTVTKVSLPNVALLAFSRDERPADDRNEPFLDFPCVHPFNQIRCSIATISEDTTYASPEIKPPDPENPKRCLGIFALSLSTFPGLVRARCGKDGGQIAAQSKFAATGYRHNSTRVGLSPKELYLGHPRFGVGFGPAHGQPVGISLTASSPFWISNNGTSTTQLIRGDVAGAPVVLNPSPQTITIPGGLPTGTVANPVATEFVLPGACASAPCGANFLFASITGNITGWDPNAPAAGSTTAVIAASHPGHVYTGLAIAPITARQSSLCGRLRQRHDRRFQPDIRADHAAAFPFVDPTIPTTPGNTYHPYNIQAIGGFALRYVRQSRRQRLA